MVQDLIVASRRMASLYRFKYIQPAHLLHAMTAIETGREVIAKEGFDTCVMRAAMIREFKAYAAQVRDAGGNTEPSDLFDKCCESYLTGEDTGDYEGGLRAIFTTIQAYGDEDRIVRVALDEANMKRTMGEPRPNEPELLPELDDLLDEETRREGPLPRAYSQPRDFRPREDRHEDMTSAFRDSAHPRPERETVRPREKLTKEMEETRAAVRASLRNLSDLARAGRLDPVVGREAEIDHVIEVLMRRRKPNVILVAEPGVGKSALVEGLAARLVSDHCPDAELARRTVTEVSLTSMVAGSRFRGDFESRMNFLVAEAESDRSILFIDEIHMLMGSGAVTRGGMDGANILKPALARDGLSLIGATTPEEAVVLRDDKALMRRFELIYLDEPGRAQMETILDGAAQSFLAKHCVRISRRTRGRLLDFGERYLSHRRNPDRAFDLLDLSAVSARLAGRERIMEADLRHAVLRLGGDLPLARRSRDADEARRLEELLLAKVKGQPRAMARLAERVTALRDAPATRETVRLSGPDGLGKTLAAETVAEFTGKRPVLLRYEDSHPEAFDLLWKRIVMALEADADAVIAVQGACSTTADRLETRLTGDAGAGGPAAPPLRSPLIFCIHPGRAEKQGIGFRQGGLASDPSTGEIVFETLAGAALDEVVERVIEDVARMQKDAGLRRSAPEDLRAAMEPHLHAHGVTYLRLRKAAMELASRT